VLTIVGALAPEAPTAGTAPSRVTTAAPQPDRRFLRIGKDSGQFTDSEYTTIATNYDYVLLSKLHGAWDVNAAHEAARELKERRPQIKVFPYMNTKLWYTYNVEGWQEPNFAPVFDDSWLLRDVQGNVVPQRFQGAESTYAFYVDMSNTAYRDWALGILAHWLEVAPYDGLTLDSANDLADGFDGRRWSTLIGPAKVNAYNAGIHDFLNRAHALVSGRGELIFNGITPASWKPSRSLEKLEYTDGATDEAFCVQEGAPYLADDIDLMYTYASKLLMFHVNLQNYESRTEAMKTGAYCFGAFLMGWHPRSSYFKFAYGSFYGEGQLSQQPGFLNFDTGMPLGPYALDTGVYTRRFERAFVAVNTTSAARRLSVPAEFDLSGHGTRLVGAHAALFLAPLAGSSS
jgi:hypothetical protein